MDTEKTRKKALAAFLKQKRQEHGWSQRDLARYIGSTQNAIYLWETEKATPDTANFDKISALFGLKTWELLQSLDESRQVIGFDLEKVLRAIEAMPPGDVAKIVSAGAQKLAEAA